MPYLSVIVPFFEDIGPVEQCLISIRRSDYRDYEIILADDGSFNAQAVMGLAAEHRARVVRLESNSGPAAARNAAAQVASGEVLVFFDADETVLKDTLARFAEAFYKDPALDALIGSYDLSPAVTGVVAIFRNLLHADVHHRSAGAVSTFWAGCGAVRREKFAALGGFDETYRRDAIPRSGAIEDVEFGCRLHEAGGKLWLDPTIQVTHHKEWTLRSMMYADIFLRARPWTELMMRRGLPHNLNFRWQDRLSVALSLLLGPLAVLGLVRETVWWLPLLFALIGIGLCDRPVLRFLAGRRGGRFAAVCFPLMLLYHFSAAVGFLLGLIRWETRRDPWIAKAALIFGVAIFGVIQFAGGAYTAEFDGQRDESAHFMTGLMVRDYLVQHPRQNPISWAEQYYLHYPRVRFGHWPPLFHLIEAAWFLYLPPSRVAALLLVGLLSWAAAIGFYRIARRVAGPAGAMVCTGLLLAAPLFQQSTALVMTEIFSLVCGLGFLDALIRLLRDGGRGNTLQVALWAMLGVMVNGIGLCLLPAPFVALLLARRWRLVGLRYLAIPGAVALGAVALWFRLTMGSWEIMARWAGIGTGTPWNVQYLLTLAGPGFALLAGLGIVALLWKQDAVAAASAGVLISTAAVAFVLRAMLEERHWILALPCLLLLGASVVRWSFDAVSGSARWAAAGAVALVALGLFPWTRYTQTPSGFAALATQVKLPARMFVSGSAWAEGSWIVVESLREPRPGSVIVRSTKLAWGYHPKLAAEMQDWMDRLAIDTVILDERTGLRRANTGDDLLRESIRSGDVWRRCGQMGQLSAYCRARPPRQPAEPLRIDLSLYLGHPIVEQ